ncbi:response regulator [Xanthobacter sp. V3C-3]|uniref:response regulator n=1 Tax=Xanthobacter lutulentifluminis TaxID=3119935 RepID=UPI00372ABC2F
MTQAEGAGETSTLLVVDADVVVRHVIADYLRGCGYVVLEAASGAEAAALLDAGGTPIDVVLADAAATGDREGFALAQWMRAAHPDVDIILAGSPEKAAAEAAQLCDDGPAVAKPYQPQQVVDRIKWLLARRARAK